MIIGTCSITMLLPFAQSLKDKRQVVKSVVARVRNEFNVSIAEVAEQDRWQRAVLGVACVSASERYAQGQIDAVLRFIEELRPDCPITHHEIEIL